MNPILSAIGQRLAAYLTTRRHYHSAHAPTPVARLRAALRPGDVLLVEGDTLISSAIRYLTQSTWSHVALYVGPQPPGRLADANHVFVEADLVEGVRSAGIENYQAYPSRICRPVGLNETETRALIDWSIAQIGRRYDLRNVIDLARYLLPNPPVPRRFRRQMIALGSGDPTRAICSTLVAEAFQSIGYPILPMRSERPTPTLECPGCREEVLRIRHHSLFAPCDFDVSPYFEVVKPTLGDGFDFHGIDWALEAAS